MKQILFKIILAIYGTLPFLVTAIIIFLKQDNLTIPLWEILAIAFQAVLIPLVLGIKQRKQAFAAFTFFIISTLIISLILGEIRSALYNIMLLKYYPGPVLTLAYTLIFRFSRFRERETMERSIRFFMLLLLSQVLMLLLISLYQSIEKNSIQILFPGISEVLNYCPALFLLNMLSISCRKELTVTKEKIIYHNSDYTALFNSFQRDILRKLCISPIIKCRDLAIPGTECPDDDFCKASKCSEYSRIYRNVQELSKKIKNLGLGELKPPENKRDIVSTGWRLILNDAILLKVRKRAPGIILLKANITEPAAGRTQKGKTTEKKQIISPLSFFNYPVGSNIFKFK